MLGAMMRGPKSIFFYFFWGGHPRFRPRGTPWGIDGPGIAPQRPSTTRSAPVGAVNDHRAGVVRIVHDTRPRPAHAPRPRAHPRPTRTTTPFARRTGHDVRGLAR